MVQINFAQKEIQCKIVYYGPGMSGKTTNLELVHSKVPEGARGELTSIATTGERTLYFDYMPLDLGQIAGIRTKFQLYTVPGQIYYKSTRRLVLQGVDGIVFVADSSASKLKENKDSLSDLEENLKEMGKTVKDLPIVIQYNKRDIPDAMSIEDLQREVNVHGFPYFEAVATKGDGIFPTLKELSGRVLEAVNKGGLAHQRPRAAPKPATVQPPSDERSTRAVSATPPVPARSSTPSRPSLSIAARSGGPSPFASPHGRTAVLAAPPAPSAAPMVRDAAVATAPAPAFQPRSMEDRVVSVSGLGGGGGANSKVLVLAVLGALIAGAVFFVLTRA